MGFRTWLYKKTGIQLKKFEQPAQQNEQAMPDLDCYVPKETYLQIKDQLDQALKLVDFYAPKRTMDYVVREEFQGLRRSQAAVQKLLDDFEFETVLDIGAGALEQSIVFSRHGKKVTAVDFGVSVYYQEFKVEDGVDIKQVIGDFNQIEFDEQFDCVWASHILEHQPNVDQFLHKVVSLTKENGIIAITVPAFDHVIVGGHMSLWNAGLVLYRLVLAGVNCANAHILSYGDNISVIVRKETVVPQGIEYDCGDLKRIKAYLPQALTYYSHAKDDPYVGNIERLNW